MMKENQLYYRMPVVILLLAIVASCTKPYQTADLIIMNANIWTGVEGNSIASSMAISGDTIMSIGTNEEIIKFKTGKTEIVDVQGGFVTPGFIDGHVHLISGGRSLLSVDLRDAATPEEFAVRIATYAKSIEPDSWILEGNWDHTLWGGELPQKNWIDATTNDNPVLVFRLDGHMALANSKALELAGIDRNTEDVPGGEIVRDKNGQPTGLLKDNAMNLVIDRIPPMSDKQKENALRAAMSYFLSHGVTSVHDVDGLSKHLESYSIAKQLRTSGDLSVRIYAAKPLNEWTDFDSLVEKNNKWLQLGALKGFVDGSLGSHTAAFKRPYSDKPGDKGFFINTTEDLYQWISGADKQGLHIMVHAIGDSAIHTLLNIYERVISENGQKDRRFRIEHAQHIDPDDIPRFKELGIIASMQPYHAIDDGRWAEELIGERIKTTYAFKSLLDANAQLVFGSDWAVAPASPLEGIYAAVTRRTLDNKNQGGWVPEQKITVEQALVAYTRDAAYGSFEENIKGTLEPGKLADFVFLSEDLTEIDPIKIGDVKVLQTYVGGKKLYERGID